MLCGDSKANATQVRRELQSVMQHDCRCLPDARVTHLCVWSVNRMLTYTV